MKLSNLPILNFGLYRLLFHNFVTSSNPFLSLTAPLGIEIIPVSYEVNIIAIFWVLLNQIIQIRVGYEYKEE